MKTAPVSKLKASLSEFLDHVKAGEEVLVTDRGKPIARIVPLDSAAGFPPHLVELERQGLVRLGTGRIPRGFWNLPRPSDPEGLSLAALLEEREEGR